MRSFLDRVDPDISVSSRLAYMYMHMYMQVFTDRSDPGT
jgi:hypothetical protein